VNKAGFLAATVILAAALTGCSPANVAPAQTPTTATPTPTPSPTAILPALTPPRQFDAVHPVRLSPVDQVSAGTLSGDVFITVNANTVWGIRVHDGSVAFSTPLGGASPAVCWQQVVDANRVYTVTLNEASDSTVPTTAQVTAVDRASGALVWTYQPPADALLAGADCSSATLTLTMTRHGLVVSLSQTDQATLGNPTTSLSWMLDPSSGQPLWQTDTAVLATDGADFGVSVAIAQIPTPMGVFFYQASPVNLATGEIGDAFWQTANSMQLAGRYQLAGRTGNNLILLAHTAGTIMTDTTVYQVSTTTGQATPQPVVKLQLPNLGDCQVVVTDRLVCTATNNPTLAYGISLTDGSQVWQHPFKSADSVATPVLFGGYLYGFDPERHVSYVLDTSDGNVMQAAAYPPAIAANETGLVFIVPQDGNSAWQCWWVPALA